MTHRITSSANMMGHSKYMNFRLSRFFSGFSESELRNGQTVNTSNEGAFLVLVFIQPFCVEEQFVCTMIEISSRIVTSSTDIHTVKYGGSITPSLDIVSSSSEAKIAFTTKDFCSEKVSSSSDAFPSARRKLSTYNSDVSSSTTSETNTRDF